MGKQPLLHAFQHITRHIERLYFNSVAREQLQRAAPFSYTETASGVNFYAGSNDCTELLLGFCLGRKHTYSDLTKGETGEVEESHNGGREFCAAFVPRHGKISTPYPVNA